MLGFKKYGFAWQGQRFQKIAETMALAALEQVSFCIAFYKVKSDFGVRRTREAHTRAKTITK